MGAVNNEKKALVGNVDDSWVNIPSDSNFAAYGAAAVRNTKGSLRAVVSQEHAIDQETGDGIHIEGSGRIFVRADDNTPTHKEKGRAVFNTTRRRLSVSDGENFLAVGGVYPGLISMSAVVPSPSLDGWTVCDGRRVTAAQDGGIYKVLVERLAGSEAPIAQLPDLRDRFVRGVDAAGTRAPTHGAHGTSDTADDVYSFQDNAIPDHKHNIDHGHEGEAGDAEWKAGFSGILVYRNPYSDTKAGGNQERFARANNVSTDLNHTHELTIENFEGDSKLVKRGTDSGEVEGKHLSDESRPDNVALYYVIKL